MFLNITLVLYCKILILEIWGTTETAFIELHTQKNSA